MTAAIETDIGRALGTDYFLLRSELTENELGYLDRTRRFVEEEVLPVMPGYWERAEVPLDTGPPAGRARVGRRRHRRLRLPADEHGRGRPGPDGAQPRRRQPRHLLRRPGRAGDAARSRSADRRIRSNAGCRRWRDGKDRRVRPDRTRPRLGLGRLETPPAGKASDTCSTAQKKWIGNGSIADVMVLWPRTGDSRSRASSWKGHAGVRAHA